MPKIQWANLPPALRQHLFDRLEERRIAAEDLYKLKLWRESEPGKQAVRIILRESFAKDLKCLPKQSSRRKPKANS